MTNTVSYLKNVNLLTKSQYDAIQSPATDELWAVEIPVVVETYDDGNGNWYRLWSDGWVEQGGDLPNTGNTTVNLMIPMRDTNYSIDVQWNGGKSGNFYPSDFQIQNITTTSFYTNARTHGSVHAYWWSVRGYAASSN